MAFGVKTCAPCELHLSVVSGRPSDWKPRSVGLKLAIRPHLRLCLQVPEMEVGGAARV